MVRTAGLEPAPGFPEQILSLLRLPFRHVRSLHHCRAAYPRSGGIQLCLTQGAGLSRSSRTDGAGRGLTAAPLLTGLNRERSISTLISRSDVSADFPTLTRSVSSRIST